MGWTGGHLEGPFTALTAIEFDLGADFASRVIDTVRYGTVIYAAVRSQDQQQVFALVLLAERQDGVLYTKPISEDMGPVEDRCPARMLDLLTQPSNDYAREWRTRCRARIAKPVPRRGERILFTRELSLTNGEVHASFVYEGGSRFRTTSGVQCHIKKWQELEFTLQR